MFQFKRFLLTVTIATLACPIFAQGMLPAINDAEVDCILRVPYPIIAPMIAPDDDVDTVKVFFRAADQPDFYWVAATPVGEVYNAILPTPGPETQDIVYYVEVITKLGEVIQSNEYRAQVVDDEDQCEDRKAAALYAGENPNLVIGSTVENAAAFPPGFDPTGVIGGVGTGGGVVASGGTNPLLVGGIVAGTLAGGIILLNDDDDNRPVSPVLP